MAQRNYELIFKLSATAGGGFTTAFTSATKDVTNLKNAMTSVRTNMKNIDAYTKTSSALAANKEKMALLTTEHERLKNEILNTTNPSTQLNSQLAKNEQQMAKTSAKISEQESKLKNLSAELRAAGVNTENLSSESARLSSQYDKLKASQDRLNNYNKQIAANNNVISQTKGQLTATITAIAIAGAAVYRGFIKPSMEFNAQMSNVQSISGATADEIAILTDKAKEMGRTTKFSATESGQAMEYMAMAGWKTNDMVNGINGVMNLAAASGEDLASVSDIVTDGLTAFGMSAQESGRFADVLAAASSNSNTNVALMGETFKQVAPVAGALNYNIEDVAIGVGLMANAGVKASQAGTSLRSIITRLAKPTKETAGAMTEIGLEITNSDGTAKSFLTTLKEMRNGMKDLNDVEKTKIAKELAGQTGMAGLLAMVNASDEDFEKVTSAINNSAGAAERMAEINLDNLAGDLTIAKSATEGLRIALGDALTPALREVLQGITPCIEKLAVWIEKNPEIIQQIAKLIMQFTSFKMAMLGGKLALHELYGAYLAGKKAIEIYKAAQLASTIATNGGTAAIGGYTTAFALATSGLGFFVGGAALAAAGAYGVSKAMEYAENQTIHFSDSLVDAFDDYKKVMEDTSSTQALIDEYRTLSNNISNYAEGTEEYANAKKRLSEIEKILIEQNPEFLTTYDAENGKLQENLGLIEQKLEKERELAKIKLQQSADEAKDKLPEAIEKQSDLSIKYDSLKEEYANTVDKRNDLLNLDQSYQNLKAQYEKGLITLDEYNQKQQEYVEKAKDIKYDLGLVGDMDTADDIGSMYEQAKQQVDTIVNDLDLANSKYVETTQSIQNYYDTQKQLIESDLGMTFENAVSSLTNMNHELVNLEKSGQGGSDKANQLRQSINDLAPKVENATEKMFELEQSVKNVPDVKTVDTTGAVENCWQLKNVIDQIKSKTVTLTVQSKIVGDKIGYSSSIDENNRTLPYGVGHFASGGLISEPTLATFAEDGPEMAIPLNNSSRSKSLWNLTGKLLGVNNADNAVETTGIRNDIFNNETTNEINITPVYNIYNNNNNDITSQLIEHDKRLFAEFDERIERVRRLSYS